MTVNTYLDDDDDGDDGDDGELVALAWNWRNLLRAAGGGTINFNSTGDKLVNCTSTASSSTRFVPPRPLLMQLVWTLGGTLRSFSMFCSLDKRTEFVVESEGESM